MVEAVLPAALRTKSNGRRNPGPLVLRICEPSRKGQIVRLKSPKCTVGSGEQCTLRVRARGVRPLHCVIIRKANRTIVRRWAADTRLNGATFTDATLATGDRLSIGAIDFEVVDLGVGEQREVLSSPAHDTPPFGETGKRDSLVEHLQTAKVLARKRTEKILARLREANRRIDELTEEIHSPSTGGETASPAGETEDGQQVGGNAGEVGGDADADLEALREQQRELEDSRNALQEDARGLAEERDALNATQQTVDEERSRLNSLRAELDQQAAAIESTRTALKSEQEELNSAREEFAKHREEMEREQLADRPDASELDARRAELDLQAAELAAYQTQLQAEQEQLNHDRAELERQREALGLERESLASERTQHEDLIAELEQTRIETERQSGIVSKEAAEMRAEREAFAEEQRKWEEARRETQSQIEQRAEQLDRQREELETQKEQLTADREGWEALQAEAEANLATRAEQLDAREAELDQRPAVWETPDSEQQDCGESVPSGGLDFLQPVEEENGTSARSNELFRQMAEEPSSRTLPLEDLISLQSSAEDADADGGAEDDWESGKEKEEDTPEIGIADLLREPLFESDSGDGENHELQADEFPSRPSAAASPENDEEMSIEQYMAGLLARVNSGDATAGQPSAAPRAASQRPTARKPSPGADEKPPVAESAVAPIAQPVAAEEEPKEERRRAAAPEKAADLVSLRELANLSAKSALDTHERKRLLQSVNTKLTVAVIAVATAGFLFWRWASDPTSSAIYYTGLAVALVAIFWAVQYATLLGYAYFGKKSREQQADDEEAGNNEPKDSNPAPKPAATEEPVTAEVADEDGLEWLD